MALGLLCRRESRKDLWPRLITLLLLYFMLLYSLLFAARWWFTEDASLRQDQAFSLFWHFCSPVHIYNLSLIMLHMQCRSLLASTLDEYSRLLCYPFSPFFLLSGYCNQMVESRSQMPPLTTTTTPRVPTTIWRPPTTRSSQEAPRQEALPFRSMLLLCQPS